jgi:hypothetical protein
MERMASSGWMRRASSGSRGWHYLDGEDGIIWMEEEGIIWVKRMA